MKQIFEEDDPIEKLRKKHLVFYDENHKKYEFHIQEKTIAFCEKTYTPLIDLVNTPQLFQFLCPADRVDEIVSFYLQKILLRNVKSS